MESESTNRPKGAKKMSEIIEKVIEVGDLRNISEATPENTVLKDCNKCENHGLIQHSVGKSVLRICPHCGNLTVVE